MILFSCFCTRLCKPASHTTIYINTVRECLNDFELRLQTGGHITGLNLRAISNYTYMIRQVKVGLII